MHDVSRLMSRPLVEANLTLFASSLATYLGIAYAFSFSMDSPSSRQASNLAILLMDTLIFLCFVGGPARFIDNLVPRRDTSRPLQLLQALACALLLMVVMLHLDYLLGRSRGAEHGMSGAALSPIKGYLVVAQILFVFSLALIRARPKQLAATTILKVDVTDILVMSLVLVPIHNYLVRNRETFTVLGAVEYLLVFALAPFVVLLFMQSLQRTLNASAAAAPIVAGLAFVHYSMPMLSESLMRPIEALFAVQLGLVLVVSGCLVAVYSVNRRALARFVVLFSVISVVGSLALAAFARDWHRPAASPASLNPDINSTPLSGLAAAPTRKPDVYLLVNDGYASPGMLRRYGINNEAHLEYLARNDFVIYSHAYSLYLASQPSMSSMMDMRMRPRAGIGGANTALRFFGGHGYKTHLVLSDHLLRGSASVMADVVFPQITYRSGLDALYRGIGGGEFKSEMVFQDTTREEWLAQKRSILSARTTDPKMLYAHSGFPGHSQNSGRCVEDETPQYARRLLLANTEIEADVETILSARRDAIIILAADHGPYLTGDCLYMAGYRQQDITAEHLADRYGTMLAVRWPDDAYKRFDRIATIQDVLFGVSAYLLEDEAVLARKMPAGTVGYGNIPDGAVVDGIVRIGRDTGKPLLPD